MKYGKKDSWYLTRSYHSSEFTLVAILMYCIIRTRQVRWWPFFFFSFIYLFFCNSNMYIVCTRQFHWWPFFSFFFLFLLAGLNFFVLFLLQIGVLRLLPVLVGPWWTNHWWTNHWWTNRSRVAGDSAVRSHMMRRHIYLAAQYAVDLIAALGVAASVMVGGLVALVFVLLFAENSRQYCCLLAIIHSLLFC